MKLDSEAAYCHSSLAHEPAPRTIEYDADKTEETGPLKADYEAIREGKHVKQSVLESENYEMDTDPLPSEKCDGDGPKARPGPCNYMMEDSICENVNESRDKIASDSIPTSDGDGHKASPGTQDYMDMEDSILGTTNESGDKNASYSNSSGGVGLSEKDADLYTDKTVTEIELSELMVYSKDNVVKDICIDDGIPPMDKVLVENDEVGQKRVGFLQSELAENVDMTEEMEDSGGPVADGSKSLLFKGQLISGEYEEVAAKSSTASLREEGGQNVGATEEIVNATTDVRTPSEESLLVTEEVVNEELLLVQEPRMGTLHDESSSCARNEDQQPYDQVFNLCKLAGGARGEGREKSGREILEMDFARIQWPPYHSTVAGFHPWIAFYMMI